MFGLNEYAAQAIARQRACATSQARRHRAVLAQLPRLQRRTTLLTALLSLWIS